MRGYVGLFFDQLFGTPEGGRRIAKSAKVQKAIWCENLFDNSCILLLAWQVVFGQFSIQPRFLIRELSIQGWAMKGVFSTATWPSKTRYWLTVSVLPVRCASKVSEDAKGLIRNLLKFSPKERLPGISKASTRFREQTVTKIARFESEHAIRGENQSLGSIDLSFNVLRFRLNRWLETKSVTQNWWPTCTGSLQSKPWMLNGPQPYTALACLKQKLCAGNWSRQKPNTRCTDDLQIHRLYTNINVQNPNKIRFQEDSSCSCSYILRIYFSSHHHVTNFSLGKSHGFYPSKLAGYLRQSSRNLVPGQGPCSARRGCIHRQRPGGQSAWLPLAAPPA